MTAYYTNMQDDDIERELDEGGMLESVDLIEEKDTDYDDDDLICLSAVMGSDWYFKTTDKSILSWLDDNDIYARMNWRRA